MANVNYVREHIRFMEYAADEGLSCGERLLWYALMHIFNRHARGSDWPEGFVRISNQRLLTYCPMKYDTLARAREALRRRGLIDFEGGERNRKNPAYRLRYLCLEEGDPQPGAAFSADDQSYPQPAADLSTADQSYPQPAADLPTADPSYPQPAAKYPPVGPIYPQPRVEYPYAPPDEPPAGSPSCTPGFPKKTDNPGSREGHIYINHTNTPKPLYKPDGVFWKEEEEEKRNDNSFGGVKARAPARGTGPSPVVSESPPDTYAAEREMVARSWKDAYGRSPTPAALDTILAWGVKRYNFETPVICEAVRMSAEKCVEKPVDYIIALFKDWKYNHIHNEDDLELYIDERERWIP